MEPKPKRFDFHMHSCRSDGTELPAEVVRRAADAALMRMALTDHDCVTGVQEAVTAGAALCITVLPAVEMDTEWPGELHILGLDLDVSEPHLTAMLDTARKRRIERNTVIFERLNQAGCTVAPPQDRPLGSVTRLHIALSLIAGGYAENIGQAFDRYLRRGCVGYYTVPRFSPEEVVAGILGAGGVPVWAHPFHGGGNVYQVLDLLKSAGICGVEAYHPSASAGESATLVSLARQNGLLVTCGSDSHGANRPGVAPGCTWRDTPELNETFDYFTDRKR